MYSIMISILTTALILGGVALALPDTETAEALRARGPTTAIIAKLAALGTAVAACDITSIASADYYPAALNAAGDCGLTGLLLMDGSVALNQGQMTLHSRPLLLKFGIVPNCTAAIAGVAPAEVSDCWAVTIKGEMPGVSNAMLSPSQVATVNAALIAVGTKTAIQVSGTTATLSLGVTS